MSVQIKAIIFDCFGVLVGDSWRQFLMEYASDDAQCKLAKDAQRAMDTGMIDESDFIDQIADITGLDKEEIVDYLFAPSQPNAELFAVIAQLKPLYKLGILSNISSKDRLHEMLTDEYIAQFDALTLSGEVGIIKPDERIYVAAAAKLGCAPDECLFIDDVERFCDAARAVGMQAIHYQTIAQVIAELRAQKVLQ